MAKRVGISDVNQSLELFLDTISNAFGGVLFIALLVCILLQLSGKNVPDPETTREHARRLEIEWKQRPAEIASLQLLQRRLAEQIRHMETPARKRRAVTYAALLAESHKQEARQAELTARQRQLPPQLAKLDELLKALRTRRAQLEAELRSLKVALREMEERNTYRIRVPGLHRTTKKEVQILVSEGRMAFIFRYDRLGRPTSYNVGELEQGQKTKSGVTLKAFRKIPGKGLPIDRSEGFVKEMRRRLGPFKPSTHYVALAVWPDSYEQCDIMRDLLIDELKFEYQLIPLKEDEPVTTGKAGLVQ